MTMPSPPPRLFCPAQQFLDMLDEMDGSDN